MGQWPNLLLLLMVVVLLLVVVFFMTPGPASSVPTSALIFPSLLLLLRLLFSHSVGYPAVILLTLSYFVWWPRAPILFVPFVVSRLVVVPLVVVVSLSFLFIPFLFIWLIWLADTCSWLWLFLISASRLLLVLFFLVASVRMQVWLLNSIHQVACSHSINMNFVIACYCAFHNLHFTHAVLLGMF